MILTVDLGNTSLKLGVFNHSEQVAFACLDEVSDDYRTLIISFLYKSALREDDIEKAIFSCVVPSLYEKMYKALQSIVKDNIIDINPDKDYGIKLDVPNPKEVGDDIIVMSAYAHHLYKKELIIVSIGTCTVLNHVTANGEFKHCIIAPGFHKMGESLWKSAAQLPEFELQKKNTFLANNTIDAMNVGLYNGYIGMLAFLIAGLKRDIGKDCYVIGCGGLGKMVIPYTTYLDEYDPDFVTKGLAYICENFENE